MGNWDRLSKLRRTPRPPAASRKRPAIIDTLSVLQWALRKLSGGDLPERVTVMDDK